MEKYRQPGAPQAPGKCLAALYTLQLQMLTGFVLGPGLEENSFPKKAV
jgi:hypothetical protein